MGGGGGFNKPPIPPPPPPPMVTGMYVARNKTGSSIFKANIKQLWKTATFDEKTLAVNNGYRKFLTLFPLVFLRNSKSCIEYVKGISA